MTRSLYFIRSDLGWLRARGGSATVHEYLLRLLGLTAALALRKALICMFAGDLCHFVGLKLVNHSESGIVDHLGWDKSTAPQLWDGFSFYGATAQVRLVRGKSLNFAGCKRRPRRSPGLSIRLTRPLAARDKFAFNYVAVSLSAATPLSRRQSTQCRAPARANARWAATNERAYPRDCLLFCLDGRRLFL